MAKFKFRLQKVLEFRAHIEQEAKDAYLEARVQKLDAESELASMIAHKETILKTSVKSLDERLTLDLYIMRCDEREYEQGIVIQTLEDEEEQRRLEWLERKKEHEAIVKLYERELDEWEIDTIRREQAELDEWAVLHRAAV